MQTRLFTSWAVAVALAASAALLAACSGSGSDKAGGGNKAEPRVLTLANPNDGGPPAQVSRWAEEVERLSDGTLAIEFKNAWRLGEPRYEAGTLEDVRAGKVDMAWVGARAFDTVGVTSFQALVAPLLIDSYELEAEVFEQGIPERMLEGVGELDLVGIGVLPGPMRKVLGVSKPFASPDDFAREVVGLQDSGVAEKTLRALGATPRAVPSSAPLEGLDAYEQQLSSIEGNGYDAQAKYVTANLNLWPRPLVIAMAKEAFGSLTSDQQSILRDAAKAAVPESLATSRAEDDDAAPVLCRRGMTFAVASPDDLADLRAALDPVYAELTSDPETKSHIDAIKSLKAEVAASAESPPCKTAEPASGKTSSIDGVYRTTVTLAALKRSPLKYDEGEVNNENWGDLTLTLNQGRVKYEQRNNVTNSSASGTYTIDGDTIVLEFNEGVNAGETFAFRWSLYEDTLTFTRDEELGAVPTPYLIEPWRRVE